MDVVVWVLMPVVVAFGTSSLVWLLMHARIEVLKARYETALRQMEFAAGIQKTSAEDAIRAATSAGRQAAFDEFLSGIRIEQRRFTRRSWRRSRLVIQERVVLRNIPLSGWTEQELPLDPGGEFERQLGQLAEVTSTAVEPVRNSTPVK